MVVLGPCTVDTLVTVGPAIDLVNVEVIGCTWTVFVEIDVELGPGTVT